MERKSAGLRARRMTEADLEPLHRLLSDPEVMRYLEPPFSREQTRAFLERAGLTPEPLILAVDDGGFAGYVIWHPYDDVSMELGWVLDRSRWGRGYSGELTRLLTDRARRQGRGVVIECVPEQTVTRHIAEKSGFRFCGMAEGCDLYCAEAVLALRERHSEVTLEAAIPCPTQADGWSEAQRERYRRILEQCDYETMVQERYTRECMQRRNRYMVDHSDLLIAVHDGLPGGTRYTIEYALRRGVNIIDVPIEE